MHLDVLVARASGTTPQPFWDGWRRLHEEYKRRIPRLNGDADWPGRCGIDVCFRRCQEHPPWP